MNNKLMSNLITRLQDSHIAEFDIESYDDQSQSIKGFMIGDNIEEGESSKFNFEMKMGDDFRAASITMEDTGNTFSFSSTEPIYKLAERGMEAITGEIAAKAIEINPIVGKELNDLEHQQSLHFKKTSNNSPPIPAPSTITPQF